MKILVMDDESLALQRVQRLLAECGLMCTCVNSLEAFEEVCSRQSFDLFILDINMPSINGIELAKRILWQEPNAFIIFQTAYENFALQAFEVGAIDYLLKPFGKSELERSLARAKRFQNEKRHTFLSKNGDETYLIPSNAIIYIQADLNEVIVRTVEHFSYIHTKISHMQTLLEENFFRIHRSYIINTSKIKKMTTVEQSKIAFEFYGIKEEIVSSKEGAKHFREVYKELPC